MVVSAERRRISVLLVEDDPDHTHLIERRLHDGGFAVHRVGSGAEALSALDGIDLVLLDYRLPGMTGLDTLQRITEIPDGPSVVMITGMGSEEIAVEAMRAGAVDYVIKDATYIRMLPEVVERAWRLHDVTRRAAQMQRLALLVSSAQDREGIFAEIAKGTRQLLRASLARLYLSDGSSLTIAAEEGDASDTGPKFVSEVRQSMAAGMTQVGDDSLFVPLLGDGGEAIGVLAVLSDSHFFIEEEVKLVETFASFASISLQNLRRRELEQRLIGELQQTLELRKNFVNSVSHELRTPLSCISGFASTVLTHWGKLDEDTVQSSVEKIQHHSAELTDLVERLLDFSGLEQGRFDLRLETLDLEHQIRRSLADLEPIIGDRSLDVSVDDISVRADASLVHRIMSNLISNAVKVSAPKGVITVRASADGTSMARVDVRDRGFGLSPEDAQRVFDPFWRSRESIKSARRGSGLGLTLVREYVGTMGGEVGVISTPGEGSTFYFTLPLAGT